MEKSGHKILLCMYEIDCCISPNHLGCIRVLLCVEYKVIESSRPPRLNVHCSHLVEVERSHQQRIIINAKLLYHNFGK